MVEIIPAILSKSFEELEDKLSVLSGHSRAVHVDMCDGKFVPSTTWPFEDDSDPDFQEIVDQEKGMPFWEDFDFEFDLMITSADTKIADFISAGASRIVVHLDSVDDEQAEQILKEYGSANDDLMSFDIAVGLAMSATTDMARVEKFVSQASFVQCMGIKKVGFQGQDFDEGVIERVRTLRTKFPELVISVDGGVHEDVVASLARAGANHLIVGSGIWDAANPSEEIERLQEIANS
ncbi:MAG TPA: hypothetical protein VMR73_00450 [Candidatus Paceibacterota bacterium]|nr:hypothetical protein [Candidatus Paceibacterota bacterium]